MSIDLSRKKVSGSHHHSPFPRHRESTYSSSPYESAIMHLIRRAAFRAASSHAAFSSRSITTSTPFVLRSKAQSAFTPSVFRRFNSDEASAEKEKSNVESAEAALEQGKQATAGEAVEAATEYVEEGAADAGAVATERAPYQPREQRSDRGGYGDRQPRSYDNNRGDRGGYGSGRGGGYGGDRGMSRGGDRDGGFARPERPIISPSSGIYVGNLLFDVAASDLEREFEPYGKITSSVIATDARGLSKGFGYVEFETVEQATAAIEAKHQTVLEGRRLVVNYMNKNKGEARGENPPSKTLFIGNLAFEMSDADLNKLFRDIRNVIDVRVAIDRRTGQPRGFAHADFVDVESATKGKEALLGKEVYGRTLRVDFSAGNREARGDGGAPGGGGRGGYERREPRERY